MTSLKRTAAQAELLVPSAKRVNTISKTESPPRELVPMMAEPEMDWATEWTNQAIAKGRECLLSCVNAVYNWWNPTLPTTTRRVFRPLPQNRPLQKSIKSSPPKSTRKDDTSSPSSSEQQTPPLPEAVAALPSSPENYESTVPVHRAPEFSLPTSTQAARMVAPIVKTDEMRRAEEADRLQAVHLKWVVEMQRRRRAESSKGGNPGTPGIVKKPYMTRKHIFQEEHEAAVNDRMDRMNRSLYEVSKADGYTEDYETFKGYLSYKKLLESSTGSLRGSDSSRREDPHHATTSLAFSESEFRRTLKRARDLARMPAPVDHFGNYLAALKKQQGEERARKDAAIEARIQLGKKELLEKERLQALAKKAVAADLSTAENAEVDRIFKKPGLVSTCGKETISQDSMQRMRPRQWLNDELINFYGAMIQERADQKLKAAGGKSGNGGKDLGKGKGRAMDIHVFTSFFYQKLTTDGYAKARLGRWTKKFDIFKKDKVIFPMNINNMHWTAGCIDFRKKRIEWYDSLNHGPEDIFQNLRKYLDLEHMDKKKKPFDFTGWEDYCSDDHPRQQNGFDCGIYTCLFMEALARDADFNWEQKNAPYFRRLLALEMGRAKLEQIPTREG